MERPDGAGGSLMPESKSVRGIYEVCVGRYSIFRDGRRQDGQPDEKTGIKRSEQIVRDRIETEQDIGSMDENKIVLCRRQRL